MNNIEKAAKAIWDAGNIVGEYDKQPQLTKNHCERLAQAAINSILSRPHEDCGELPFIRWLFEHSNLMAERYLRMFQDAYKGDVQTDVMLKSWFANHNEDTKKLLEEYKSLTSINPQTKEK